MTIPRFFIDLKFIDEASRTIVCPDAKLVKQIRKVLRLENGAKLDLLDGKGNIYHCILQNFQFDKNSESFTAVIKDKQSIKNQLETNIAVALPLIKQARFEWALEKLTELGVCEIIPVALDRSVVKLSNNGEETESNSKFLRWQKIVQEAAEQCERSMPPNLARPTSFKTWLEQLPKNQLSELRIICVERQDTQSLENLLYNQKFLPSRCAIAFGAEGGLTEEEIKLALSYQFKPVSLGSLILRTETATIYTLAIVNAFLRLIQKDPQL
jgi:16S rRNA (uracil1498-N3)-methyltransferase